MARRIHVLLVNLVRLGENSYSEGRLRLRIVPLLALGAVALVLLIGSSGRTYAGGGPTTFTVNLATDGPPGACDVAGCTLREAIIAANLNLGADTIKFDPNVFTSLETGLIQVTSALDYADATEGITIDATGTPVYITPCSYVGCNILWGLVFITPLGTTAQNILVRGVSVSGFQYDGFQVCGGDNIVTHTCDSDINNVTVENSEFVNNVHDGLRIFGDHVSNVTLNKMQSLSNGEDGIRIQAATSTNSLSFTSVTSDHNARNGILVSGGSSLVNANFQTIKATSNGFGAGTGDGIELGASVSMSGVSLKDVTERENDGAGIRVVSFLAVDDITISDAVIFGVPPGGETTFGYGIAIFGFTHVKNAVVTSNVLTNVEDAGIFVAGQGNFENITISGNTVKGSSGNGISVNSQPQGYSLGLGNVVIEENTVSNNEGAGIFVQGVPLAAQNVIRQNKVTNNYSSGIEIASLGPGFDDSRVTISQNITHDNSGLGINLVSPLDPINGVTPNDSGDLDTGANGLLNFPVITGSTPDAVTGTACAGCLVELFSTLEDPSVHGEGAQFLRDGIADSGGNFAVVMGCAAQNAGTILTATATDQVGNTSEFSANFELTQDVGICSSATPTPTASPSPTPTGSPGHHKQGDLDCNGHISGDDGLMAVQFAAGIPMNTPGGCLPLGLGNPPFGDVTCNGLVDGRDTVAILEYAAHVAIKPTPIGDCTSLGEELS